MSPPSTILLKVTTLCYLLGYSSLTNHYSATIFNKSQFEGRSYKLTL